METGSIAERIKCMKQIELDSTEEICIIITHDGQEIGKKVIKVHSIDMMVSVEGGIECKIELRDILGGSF